MRKFIIVSVLFLEAVVANPKGGEVISGSCQMEQKGQLLEIKASDKSIIHWKDFSIDTGEITRFIQPATSSAVLNRVMSSNVSKIMGTLKSNGRVYLINPNGILIGKGGKIDTGSFIASSLDVHDKAFINNEELEFSGLSKNGVINFGTITAWDGDVYLLGFLAQNHGQIETKNGNAFVIGTDHILLKPSSEKRIYIKPKTVDQQKLTTDGNPYSSAFIFQKEDDALESFEQAGQVFLSSSAVVTGSITSKMRNGEGAEVYVLGDRVIVDKKAQIDISSKKGKGSIYVGGGCQGKDTNLKNSKNTYVGKDSVFIASANQKGDGGSVYIWSDGETHFEGFVDVRGGSIEGDGGFVEISGKKGLKFLGSTDRSCVKGKRGTLLLDPDADVIIHQQSLYDGSFRDSIWKPIGPESYIEIGTKITPGTLLYELENGNVVIQTKGNTFENSSGNIIIKDDLVYNLLPGNHLTLETDADVLINAKLINTGLGDIIIKSCKNLILDSSSAKTPVEMSCFEGKVHIQDVKNDLRLIGGDQEGHYSLIGYLKNRNLLKGNIEIDHIGNNLLLKGGEGRNAFALIGTFEGKSSSGDILINEITKDLILEGGKHEGSFAQIGHCKTNKEDGFLKGHISIHAVDGDVKLIADGAKAHIGHGSLGDYAYDQKGNISIQTIKGNCFLQGAADHAFSQIGHATCKNENGNKTGDVNLTAVYGRLELKSGEGKGAQAHIGHGGSGGKFDRKTMMGSIHANAGEVVVQGEQGNSFSLIGMSLQDANIKGQVKIVSKEISVGTFSDITIRSGGGSDAVIGAIIDNHPSKMDINISRIDLKTKNDMHVLGYSALDDVKKTTACIGLLVSDDHTINQYHAKAKLYLTAGNSIYLKGADEGNYDHPAYICGSIKKLSTKDLSTIYAKNDISIIAGKKGNAGIIYAGPLKIASQDGKVNVFSTENKEASIEVYGHDLEILAFKEIDLKNEESSTSGAIYVIKEKEDQPPTVIHSGSIYHPKDDLKDQIETITIAQTNSETSEDLRQIIVTPDTIFIGTYFEDSNPDFNLKCNLAPFDVYYKDCTSEVMYQANILISEFLFRMTPLVEYLGWEERFSICVKDINKTPWFCKNRNFYIRRPYDVNLKGFFPYQP